MKAWTALHYSHVALALSMLMSLVFAAACAPAPKPATVTVTHFFGDKDVLLRPVTKTSQFTRKTYTDYEVSTNAVTETATVRIGDLDLVIVPSTHLPHVEGEPYWVDLIQSNGKMSLIARAVPGGDYAVLADTCVPVQGNICVALDFSKYMQDRDLQNSGILVAALRFFDRQEYEAAQLK